ncbi:MAG TPA: LysR family transcriptional regulator [Xanthobacteraceae bacterium]|jgi:DNA-binding transcriptional LysR family regulator|nr:LysR family transcriptional regulator [Xanthobacteraceae bacterium]
MNRLSLRALQYFLEAARHKSVSAAARKLHISPASVSVAIADLETDLDVQLFVRQPAKGMKLTPAGEVIVAEAHSLLSHADEFQQRAGALGDSLAGELSVACFTNLGPAYFSNLLAQFCSQHPSVSIKIYVGDQQEILSGLLGGQFELAVTFDLDIPKNFEWLNLASIPPQIVLPANHALAKARRISLKRLASEPLILMDLPHTRDYFMSLFHRLHISPNVRFSSTNFEMVRTLVGNGLGYSILNLVPNLSTTYDGTRVKYVPISDDVRPLQVGCLSVGRVAQRRVAKAFIDQAKIYFSIAHKMPANPNKTKRK